MSQRKTSGFIRLWIAVMVLAALRWIVAPSEPGPESPSPTPEPVEPAPEVQEGLDAPAPAIQEYAAACFHELRARNPVGRIVKFNANRLGDRCSIIVETDAGSGRWLFDWRDGERGYRREGEVRWPEAWAATLPEHGIDEAEFSAQRIAERVTQGRAHWPEDQREDWLYEIVWLPAPFARPVVFLTFSDSRPEAGPYDGHSLVYADAQALDGRDLEEANGLYPLTRFELREDHNFKGALFESTALAEAAVSLEGSADRDPGDPLAASAERCMHWLHEVNAGSRVLRMALDAGHCWLLQENAHVRDDFYLFSAQDTEHYEESASLALEPPPRANLLLDRSRLSAARVRERLHQARAAQPGLLVQRIAVAWVEGEVHWQFDASLDARRVQIWLDEDGAASDPPLRFPLTAIEQAVGFPASDPLLDTASEAVVQ